jgi:hypothetical protein
VFHETFCGENGDLPTNTKRLRRDQILNKFETVSAQQTIISNQKVAVVHRVKETIRQLSRVLDDFD